MRWLRLVMYRRLVCCEIWFGVLGGMLRVGAKMDEYQEWLHMTWGFGSDATQHVGEVSLMKLEDKYREMTEEERAEEQRKLDAYEEREQRRAVPMCGGMWGDDIPW